MAVGVNTPVGNPEGNRPDMASAGRTGSPAPAGTVAVLPGIRRTDLETGIALDRGCTHNSVGVVAPPQVLDRAKCGGVKVVVAVEPVHSFEFRVALARGLRPDTDLPAVDSLFSREDAGTPPPSSAKCYSQK